MISSGNLKSFSTLNYVLEISIHLNTSQSFDFNRCCEVFTIIDKQMPITWSTVEVQVWKSFNVWNTKFNAQIIETFVANFMPLHRNFNLQRFDSSVADAFRNVWRRWKQVWFFLRDFKLLNESGKAFPHQCVLTTNLFLLTLTKNSSLCNGYAHKTVFISWSKSRGSRR